MSQAWTDPINERLSLVEALELDPGNPALAALVADQLREVTAERDRLQEDVDRWKRNAGKLEAEIRRLRGR